MFKNSSHDIFSNFRLLRITNNGNGLSRGKTIGRSISLLEKMRWSPFSLSKQHPTASKNFSNRFQLTEFFLGIVHLKRHYVVRNDCRRNPFRLYRFFPAKPFKNFVCCPLSFQLFKKYLNDFMKTFLCLFKRFSGC